VCGPEAVDSTISSRTTLQTEQPKLQGYPRRRLTVRTDCRLERNKDFGSFSWLADEASGRDARPQRLKWEVAPIVAFVCPVASFAEDGNEARTEISEGQQ
jgi:hypothetical protein